MVDSSTLLPALLTATLTTDAGYSAAIDRGDPTSSFANEPTPNGGYIDIGAFGNTSQASLSLADYLLVTTPDGGEVWPAGQTFPIRWRSSDLANSPAPGPLGPSPLATIELVKSGSVVATIASSCTRTTAFSIG